MDTATTLFAVMTLVLLWVSFQARRLGNEKRDVALLGTLTGLGGVGTAVTALL